MSARIAVAIAVVVVASLLPGASRAGSYLPPPGDTRPSWSPDGDRIAFLTERSGFALVDVPANGGAETRRVEVKGVFGFEISPDWRWVAYLRHQPDGQSLWVSRRDGSEARFLTKAGPGAGPVWSPDSRGLIFHRADGALALVDLDGGTWTLVPSGGFDPVFSPDGRRIAFAAGREGLTDLYVLDFSDGRPRLLVRAPGSQVEPKWSPDGSRIAFLTRRTDGELFRLGVVQTDGRALVTYRGPQIRAYRSFAWMPARDAIVFEQSYPRPPGIVRLDLRTGRTVRLTRLGETPSPSRDGRSIAFAATGECRDRYGIYVAESDGTDVRRLTNSCRILGTPADDVLRGSGLADVLLGVEGDDRLMGFTGGYMGDTLMGGAGNDLLIGTGRNDLLRGGRGADRLFGGLSADVLYGDSGPDRIDAQAGRDFVHAQDGERDLVLCGTNHGPVPERDRAWVDGVDVVRGCEIVHRRGG
jgi:Tol biopolymer transport system component